METIIRTPVGLIKVVENDGIVSEISETNLSPTPFDKLSEPSRQILEYFEGRRKEFTFRIALQGTEFQKKVWNECRKIPFGSTVTYGELAARIGRPKASRAIGGALNVNNLLFYVPCHRVVASGSLGGFRLGQYAKQLLLALERAQITD